MKYIMNETIRHSKMNADIESIVRASQNDISKVEEKIRSEISLLPKRERKAIYINIKNYLKFIIKILENIEEE